MTKFVELLTKEQLTDTERAELRNLATLLERQAQGSAQLSGNEGLFEGPVRFQREVFIGKYRISWASGELVFNEQSADVDFRVEGDTNVNLFKIDAGLEQVSVGGFLNIADSGELTIASGVITATGSHHTIDTQADAASDDLDTINGGSDGDILIVRAEDSTHTVVLKDGGGNLTMAGDFSLDDDDDYIMFIKRDPNWRELSRSDNG